MNTVDTENHDEMLDEIDKMLLEADRAAEISDVRLTREEVFSRLKAQLPTKHPALRGHPLC